MELDRKRIDDLTLAVLLVVKAHYESAPTARERVFEVLNALAVATAVTLEGTELEAARFFFAALSKNLDIVNEVVFHKDDN